MKKFLLTVALVGSVLLGKSQIVVLNEIYTDPGSGNSEFFELYNSSGGSINTDCYTVITYYTEGSKQGFYVMDLPVGSVPATGYFVGASIDPFNVQGQMGKDADFSWNSMPASGSLTKWERTGGTYTDVTSTIPSGFNDFFQKQTGSGAAYSVFVYANGILVNAFFGGVSSSTIPAEIRAMPDLPVNMIGCTDFIAEFEIAKLADNRAEYVTPTPGNDNGYIRKRDGQCGAWDKGAPGVNHTPGATNGEASATGSLTVSAVMDCALNADGNLTLNYAIISGPLEAFPVKVIIYEDLGRAEPGDGTLTPNINEALLPNAEFGFGDTVVFESGEFAGASGPQSFVVGPPVSPDAYTFPFPNNQRDARNFIVVFQTPAGCFDQIRFPNQCAVLPVDYKSFTATRNRSTVVLKWETSFEQNSAGFAVERNIGGTWQEIAYVPSQAQGGNSDALLTYTYNDFNNNKGVTQYRIRQMDFDGRNKLSEIRAVRGEGQIGSTIVYPNPTSDGKVTVVFDAVSAKRDMSLIDMTGRVIRQWKGVTNNNIQIDNLTPGVFSLRIVIPETGEQSVEKIVVNKR